MSRVHDCQESINAGVVGNTEMRDSYETRRILNVVGIEINPEEFPPKRVFLTFVFDAVSGSITLV